MRNRSLSDALILNAVRAIRALCLVLPLGVSLFLARLAGAAVHRLTKRRKVAYRNLRAAFAGEKSSRELRRIARRSAENLMMSLVEILRFPETDRKYVDRHFTFEGDERLKPSLESGRGMIFITGHFGNWEFQNVAGNLKGYPTVALVRLQKHPRSDAYLNELRTSKGAQVIRKGMPIREILRALRAGKIVGIVADQDGGKRGTFVRFFGRLSSTPPGAAAFSLRTGAPIHPVFIFRENLSRRHRIEVEPALPEPDPSSSPEEAEHFVLQRFADVLETKIRKSPEQWLWAHRRWKSSPDRRVLVLSDGRAGHLNQSLAIVDALRAEHASRGFAPETFSTKTVEVRYRSEARRRLLSFAAAAFGGRPPFFEALTRAALAPETFSEIDSFYADVTVSAGSSTAAPNLFAAALNEARSVVAMRPPFGLSRFDAVVVPRHDRPRAAENVFVTECAPSRLDRAALAAQGEKLSERLALNGSPRVGFLVGGDTERVRFREDLFGSALDSLVRFSEAHGALVLATSSRRTPAWAGDAMKRALGDKRRCPYLVIARESNPPDAVGSILGASDVVAVSGESMSMVSEAVLSGKRVVVFTPAESPNLKPKYRAFLERLRAERRIVTAEPSGLGEALRAALSGTAGPEAPKDADVLRQAARKVL